MKATRRRFLTLAGGATLGAIAAPNLLRLGARAVQAQAIPGAPSFKGAAGKSIQGPVTLNAGLTVLRAQHNGTSNFSVTLLLPNPAEAVQQSIDDGSFTDSALVYDEIGALKEGAATLTGTPGD